jgi:hypothetical protein
MPELHTLTLVHEPTPTNRLFSMRCMLLMLYCKKIRWIGRKHVTKSSYQEHFYFAVTTFVALWLLPGEVTNE